MSAIVEQDVLRILRPLLGVVPARLKATLRAAGQSWIDDPSNVNPAFARVRARARLNAADAPSIATADYGRDRREAEAATAAFLASSVAIHPEGWATLDFARWDRAEPRIVSRALASLVLAVSGGSYAPRSERLAGLQAALLHRSLGGGRTLGGCRFVPRRGQVLVTREPEAAAERVAVTSPGRWRWDERFVVRLEGEGPWSAQGLVLARLGGEGWRTVAAAAPAARNVPVPAAARPALPALFDLEGVLEVPHLSYRRQGVYPVSVRCVSVAFCPRHALAGPGFAVI